ncbi:MAG: arylamine N-acetyltransferase [Clostridia bacterium]
MDGSRPSWAQPYLPRLRIRDVAPPSTNLLTRLQQAHLAHVPGETAEIFAARSQPINEPTALRLVTGQRSGYCFDLNAAFAALRTAMGFEVRRHRARVQTPGCGPRVAGRHIALRSYSARASFWSTPASGTAWGPHSAGVWRPSPGRLQPSSGAVGGVAGRLAAHVRSARGHTTERISTLPSSPV